MAGRTTPRARAAHESLKSFLAVTVARQRARLILAHPLNGEPVDVTEDVISLCDLVSSSLDWGSGFWDDNDLQAYTRLARLLNFTEDPSGADHVRQ